MVEHYIESYLIHEFSSRFCMILLRGNLPLVLILVPLGVWITCQYNTGFYNENYCSVPDQIKFSLVSNKASKHKERVFCGDTSFRKPCKRGTLLEAYCSHCSLRSTAPTTVECVSGLNDRPILPLPVLPVPASLRVRFSAGKLRNTYTCDPWC
jgi:hypothetical protein